MNTLIRLFQLAFIPTSSDLGLLILRIWLGISMLALHGWGKLTSFDAHAGKFPDPLGVGSQTSLILALVGEVLCPILLVLGFISRLAALGAAVTMGVAWYCVHQMALTGEQSGELAFIYLAGFSILVFTGAGRFALDASVGGGGSSRVKPPSSKK